MNNPTAALVMVFIALLYSVMWVFNRTGYLFIGKTMQYILSVIEWILAIVFLICIIMKYLFYHRTLRIPKIEKQLFLICSYHSDKSSQLSGATDYSFGFYFNPPFTARGFELSIHLPLLRFGIEWTGQFDCSDNTIY